MLRRTTSRFGARPSGPRTQGRSPRSDSHPDAVRLERFATLTVEVADALGWAERFLLVGHSHGGGVAQELVRLSSRTEILASMVHVALGDPCGQLARCASQNRCPILFLHGKRDGLVPLENARAGQQRIVDSGGRSEFHVIPRAGHALMDSHSRELGRRTSRFASAVTSRSVRLAG